MPPHRFPRRSTARTARRTVRAARAARLIAYCAALTIVCFTSMLAARGAPPSFASPAAVGPRWLPPLSSGLQISAPFRAPEHDYGPGHRGIDLSAAPGESVGAPSAGTVTFAGTVVDRGVITVRVDPQTVYSIEPIDTELSAGDTVGLGSPIGFVGAGGHCTAACAHIGVRVDDRYVDPARYFYDRPVLLPW